MENKNTDGREKKNIQIGAEVEIVQKQDQRTGELIDGIVKRILTKSANHPHGIKVILETGEVGRVKISYYENNPKQLFIKSITNKSLKHVRYIS